MIKQFYKNKLVLSLIKPFENKRLFSPLQLAIFTLKDYGYWPEKLIALDPFCQTGLQWTRIFYPDANYIEMWDIDPEAIKYAKKEFQKAKITCGDSIDALKNKKFERSDFNFVLIDAPIPFEHPDGSFEHFGFFDDIFKNIANQCVIIVNVAPHIKPMLMRHPESSEHVSKWEAARRLYYSSEDGSYVHPEKMIHTYTARVNSLGYEVKLCTYNARNGLIGYITLVVSK
jgi:hypothetical protein